MSERTVIGFMCRIDWDHEIGGTDVSIYPSVASLIEKHECAENCGIVEVEVIFRSVVLEGNVT